MWLALESSNLGSEIWPATISFELQFQNAMHLEGTSQPLIAAHRLHMMCRKNGWYSKSTQDWESGALEIAHPGRLLRFGLIPINGIYCFNPEDVYLPAENNGEIESPPTNAAAGPAAVLATTRAQAATGRVKAAPPAEVKETGEDAGPVEEKKTHAVSSGPAGESRVAVKRDAETKVRETDKKSSEEDVCGKTDKGGGSYAPVRPGFLR